MNRRHGASQDGIALLLVLWVLTILMVIVMSFSYMTRTETYATLSFKEGIENKFLAEAGIERGIMELFYRNHYKDQIVEIDNLGVWKTDGSPYEGQIDAGSYTVKIVDESGKVDINTTSDVVLKNLLMNMGIRMEDADTITDSIMDWKDSDDLHRLHGAESDFYMSLPNPYKAKNARFDTIEELLLVKGMTPDILYGTPERTGIMLFLTVKANSNTININAAPKEVLAAIPGSSPEIADSIISYRQNKEIQDIQDVAGILGSNLNIMIPYLSTEESGTFTIDAFGHKGAPQRRYAIRATVVISDTEETHRYLYYKSPANIQP